MKKLSDALEQSLILEGTAEPKARQMTVSKVVETCRKSARNDLTRTVLAAGQFENPKDVLTKFITEVGDQIKDRQVLAYRQQSNRRGQNYNHRGRSQLNNNNNNYNNNYNNQRYGQINNRNNQRYMGNRNFSNRNFSNRGNSHSNSNFVRVIQGNEQASTDRQERGQLSQPSQFPHHSQI